MDPRTSLDVLEERKTLVSAGIQTRDNPTHSLVVIQCTLFRLLSSLNNTAIHIAYEMASEILLWSEDPKG